MVDFGAIGDANPLPEKILECFKARGLFCLSPIDNVDASVEARWDEARWSQTKKTDNGISGFATLAGQMKRIHVCAHLDCASAKYAATKWGGAP